MIETEISWFSWGKKAFHRAKELRPIILAISAVWRHWCHVMDQRTYIDRDVRKGLSSAIDNGPRPCDIARDFLSRNYLKETLL